MLQSNYFLSALSAAPEYVLNQISWNTFKLLKAFHAVLRAEKNTQMNVWIISN